jgi:predicted ATPase/DNA-binding SARP family transcriptional activator
MFLLGPPRIELDGAPIEVDTRKAVALMAYLGMTGASHSRDTLATLLWPEYDQTHARAALRRTLSTLNKALGGDWLDVERESVALRPTRDTNAARLWVDVEQFQHKLAELRGHGHAEAEVCSACLEPLSEAAALYRDDFMAGFTLRDSPNFDDWQFFQSESLRRRLAGALEKLARTYSLRREFEAAIPHARRWLALDPLHEPAHRQLMQLYARAGERGAALRQYRECVRVLEEELGVPPLAETTQLYQAIKEQALVPPRSQPPPVPVPARPGVRARGRGGPGDGAGRGAEGLGGRGAGEHGSRGAEGQRSSVELAPKPASINSGAPVFPLVGRSQEWAALMTMYTNLEDAGHFIVLDGEAGIGKTRLAEEFLAYVRSQGGATIAARCYEGETNLAYGPFVEGLGAAINQTSCTGWLSGAPAIWLSEVARLLPELASLRPDLPGPPPLDSPGAQSRFFEAISQLLPALCSAQSGEARPAQLGQGPAGVLFIDDLQWADTASLDLLTYLVRRLRRRRLCILVTWRGEHMTAAHRLRHLLAEAQRAGTGTALSLERLQPSAVMELVQWATHRGLELPAGLDERLYHETEGLPFFLVEYLTMMARGADSGEDDAWPMPGGVRDLLHTRLEAVSETGRQLLTTAAVIGRSFDFDTLRAASGRSDEETVSGLESLIAQRLIEEIRSGGELPAAELRELSYDFGHEKLRALVYEETSLARRRLLHRRVAEALVGRMGERREYKGGYGGQPAPYLASQVAYHYQLAGQESEAARFFKLAGEHARGLYANAEALAHFQSALALGYADASGLYEAMGDLQTLRGEYGAALTSYETAAAHCAAGSLAGLEHKLGNVHHRRGEWELAESHFQAGLAALGEGGLPGQRARLYADWSRTAHQRGQTERALGLAQRGMELAETADDLRALAQAHNMLGILASSRGALQIARHHLEHSLALAQTLGDPAARVAALNNLALACRASGDLERAFELTEAALILCASQGDRHRQAALHNNLADLFYATGQTEAAMAHLKQAVTIFAEIGEEAGTWQPEIWKLVEW